MSQTAPEADSAEGAALAPPPAPLLDIDLLLKPITVEEPCGADLRYEGTYDLIREARRADDASLPQGVWVSELKRANWREVEKLCFEALTLKSKDLQIAAWMAEALIHLHGLQGARDGIHLIRALCEAFWDDLHPNIPSDGDLEFRLAALHWMNERMPLLLRLLPITQPEAGEESGGFSLDDWENTSRLEVLAQRDREARDRAEAEGKPSRAKFLTTVTLTPRNFYRDLTLLATECLGTLEELQALLDEKCGEDGPNLATLRKTLDALRENALEFYREKGGTFDETPAAEAVMDAALFEYEQPQAAAVFSGQIRSRDEAYRMLALASDFLMKAEPHSPTPYLVRRAVAWGSMSLDELLQELVSSEQDLTQLYSLLGMSKMGGKMPKR
jgi:type VI secretion system ImpA family protein